MKGIRVQLICVGKMKEKFYIDAAAEYVKRLSAYCKLQVVELPEERLPSIPGPDRRRPGEGGGGHPRQAGSGGQPGRPVRGGAHALQRGTLRPPVRLEAAEGEAVCPSSSAAPTALPPPSRPRRGPSCPCPP